MEEQDVYRKRIGQAVETLSDPADRQRVYEHIRAGARQCSGDMHPHVVWDTFSDPSGIGRFLVQALAAVLRGSTPQGVAVCDLLHDRYTERDESTHALWLIDQTGRRLAMWKSGPYLCVRPGCGRLEGEHRQDDGRCPGFTTDPREAMSAEQRYELGLE